MKVGVVYGGTPEESPASILNARDAARALENRGYSVELIEFEKDIISVLKQKGCDVVFLCVQGKGYGDGTFQAMLEHEGIAYTGSDMRSACLINDKILCKLLFDRCGIRTPEWEILTRRQFDEGNYDYAEFGYPFVAKSPTRGRGFGMSLIKSEADIPRIMDAFESDDTIFLERYIKGRFFTVGFYEKDGRFEALPVVEGIDLDHEYDKGNKLITFNTGNFEVKFSDLSDECNDEILDISRRVCMVTNARGLARVDLMVSDDDGLPYVLEINAVPGLKEKSLIPKAAILAGIDYSDMVESILRSARSTDSIDKGVAYV